MAGNMDKIQLPTNSTDISTLVRYLKGIKASEPLNNNTAQGVYQAVKATGRKQKSYTAKVAEADGKMPARDTHTTGTLATYGLIRYIDNNKPASFVVSDLGCELIALYDAEGKPLKNADGVQLHSNGKYVVMLLRVFSAWHETGKGRDIHPGKIMLQLMSDPDLDYYLTEHDVAYFTSNPDFKSDNQYIEIKNSILDFRQKYDGVYGFTSKPCKAEIFMPTFVRNWGLFQKKEIYEIAPDASNPGHFFFTLKSSSATSDDEIDEADVEDSDPDDASVGSQVGATHQAGSDPDGLGKSIDLETLYKNVTHYVLANGADVYCDMVFRQDGDYDWIYTANEKTTPDFAVLSPEWFHDKAQEFAAEDSEAAAMYIDFNSRFGIDALSALSGEDLLKTLFLGASSDNLCHELEYVARNTELFGSVKGGNAFKYPMFFDKEASMWTSGTRANPKQLSLDEAIIKGTAVRDGLVKGADIIKNSLPVDSVEDYLTLYTELYAAIPDLVDSLWVIKYYHLLFPELIPVFYNKDWQIRVLAALKITPNDTAYGRLGQIDAFVKECDVTNVAFARVFHKYCRNISVDEHEDIGLDEVVAQRVKGGTNIILYGVPGAGKSWTIKHEYCDDESRMERLVFHPDYTYSDFVGQILPKVGDDGSVSYEFSAGPFTKLVRKAYINPDKMYYLVIEEVNRGNAPAIFGDVFQLLDRDKDGASEYEITNADIAKIVYLNDSHKVSIPSNMCILCTMNTSDQNVFTLDTAFQRRWNMRLIKNKFHDEEDELRFAGTKILDTDVTWEKFFTEINSFILGKNIRMTSSEDKRLGTHFVSEEDLAMGDGSERQISRFPEKVLKYLWDDAFKFTKEDVFDLEKVKSLEDVIELFVSSTGNARFLVFKENIYNSLVPKSNA